MHRLFVHLEMLMVNARLTGPGLLFAAALVLGTAQAPVHGRESVTVFAAASLREALNEVARGFEEKTAARVVMSYAASSALARQIERGAPADVVISADLEWMRYLAGKGFLRAGSQVELLTNSLALIAPQASRVELAIAPGFALAQTLGSGRLAMADVDAVPAGKYGRAALEALGVWREVALKVVRAVNVRAALAFVARGEAPLGIVYHTDALAEPKVRTIALFPPALHPPIIYPAAIVAASRSPAAAAFLGYLRGAEARAVWQHHGFGTRG